MENCCARLECLFGVNDCIERVVIDLNQIDGILSEVRVRGDRYGDRLADEADFSLREYRVKRHMIGRRDAGYWTKFVFDIIA